MTHIHGNGGQIMFLDDSPGDMRMSDDTAEIAAALVAVQLELENPPLDSENPHFKSKFTSLATLCEHIRHVAATHGIVVYQTPTSHHSTGWGDGGQDAKHVPWIGMRTMLMHTSGQYIEASFVMPLKDIDPQKVGSILTYFRRYALAAAFNLQGEVDDDAESVSAPIRQRKQRVASMSLDDNPATQGGHYAQGLEGLRKQFFAVAHAADLDSEQAKSVLKQRWQLHSFNDASEDMLRGAIDAMRELAEKSASDSEME